MIGLDIPDDCSYVQPELVSLTLRAVGEIWVQTPMGLLNFIKYRLSLRFMALTLSLGLLLLAHSEQRNARRMMCALAVLGSTPVLFYLLEAACHSWLRRLWREPEALLRMGRVRVVTWVLAPVLLASTQWLALLKARRYGIR